MIYTVSGSFTLTNAGGDVDLLELLPATDYPVKLLALTMSQSSEIAEAQEENLLVQLIRLTATVTGGSGGSAPNIEAVDPRAPSNQFAAEMNNTTLATTSGSIDILETFAWNVRATPYDKEWYDEKRQHKFRAGQALILRHPGTITDDATFQFTATIEEF